MTRNIGLIVFNVVEELDFIGPYEAFGMLRLNDASWQPLIISEDGKPVRCAHGLRVEADASFETAPQLEVILVPGGFGTRAEATNPKMLDFLRRQGVGATWITSVCTGALVLHAAGFLTGKRATTYWGVLDMLRGLGDVTVVDDERWVHDGNVITAAGVSAGIDMSLYLISLLKDAATAKHVQQMMEYYPKPPVFQEAAP